MSGHSKWSTIKRKKGAQDAKRGNIFTKLMKEITVAARMGGGDPEGNPRLRSAIQAAKAANMPKDNIERAIKKGTGELEGVAYEEATLEGYGPGGVAVLVEVVTDNRNRTVAEVRHLFSKNNGSLGEVGCVAWMFDKRGMIVLEGEGVDEDRLMEVALDAGAEDIQEEEGTFTVITTPENFETVRTAIEAAGWHPVSAQIEMVPQNTVRLEGKEATQALKLMEMLEECDDVSNVYSNFDIPDEIVAAHGQA